MSLEIIGGKVDERISECFAMVRIMREETVAFLFYVLSFALFTLTLVPPFEVYTLISVNEISSILFVVPALAVALILQCIPGSMDSRTCSGAVRCTAWIQNE